MKIDRRTLLQAGAGGFTGMLLSRFFQAEVALAQPARPAAKAKSVIVLWMNGGPSHVDTFDPKPGAPGSGPFKAIATRNKALRICEHLPRVAGQAHHLAVVRGMTSKEGNHHRARYLLH